jgi:hypothetical protein
VRWFNPHLATFAPDSLDAVAKHLSISPAEWPAVQRTLDRMVQISRAGALRTGSDR